jgi:D-beta-D-heptose 7-phosphate kinase/D-beta-D-heptose 1-phosphate adenosyltransferase
VKKFKSIVEKFKGKKILVIGDLMLDEHIWSKVGRISPEAPVPVAEVMKITHVPGGCGNVAANIAAMGGTPILVGLIGKDSSGEKLKSALKKANISTKYIIQTAERPTILKSRIIAASQHMVRVDREKKEHISQNLYKRILASIKKIIPQADGIIISDYKKGILTPKVCKEIISQANKYKIPVSVDPKGKDYSKYRSVTIITPNAKEAQEASGVKIENENDLAKAGKVLLRKTNTKHILITRGKDGMSLFSQNGNHLHVPAVPREVFDITGAGDTVISALTISMACKAQTKDVVYLANLAAAISVGKIGTQAVSKKEIIDALDEKDPGIRKIKSRKEIAKISQKAKEENAKIVFTNGCFDILHLGHVRYLKEAKKLGDILIVGLNSDSSVRKLKGNSRPYIPENERAEILASLEYVDYVTIFSELRPDKLIETVRPDVHVKGGDYKIEELPERKVVKSLRGEIIIIPPIAGRSTTSLIDKILKRKEK